MPEGLVAHPLSTAVALDKIRFFLTTKSLTGGDSRAEFHWWDFKRNQASCALMLLDRKAGGTDLFEQPFPNLLVFDNLTEARTASFRLIVRGTAVWVIDHFTLTGKFKQLGPLLQARRGQRAPAISWGWADLGWRLMAFQDEDIVVDPRQSAEGFIQTLRLNGTF